MAKTKTALLLTAAVLLLGPAAALNFEVAVDSVTKNNFLQPSKLNDTETLQVFNVTAENVGSIGCNYRLKAEFQQGDQRITRYSKGYPLWSGNTALMELKYIPMNYTGQIHANISATYCGLEDPIASFSFNSTQRNIVDSRVGSQTLEANSTRAQVEIVSVENGTLIPEESPPYWRISSSEIEDGKARITYDAPIFRDTKNLTYTVLDSEGEILGNTEVSLKTRPTLVEKLKDRLPEILAALLGLSVLVNIYQVRRKILPEKVFEKIEKIEFGDRDIKK